ncbi:ScbR family autoregulator-binding transcription factor [Streptomyces boninensis]|uniref:ScbR family autoregulator-binding transcription factor n=1 Tax=Streptomyces boninensis TaxID=2039455 RepID=UPI003B223422
MAKQERSERTRKALVEAAAVAFDRDGFTGASLTQISGDAGVTKGALSFHFASKDDLADAVQELAVVRTRQIMDSVIRRPAPALQSVIDATHVLARLLHEDVTARAGVRLSRERDRPHPQADWYTAWLQPMRGLLLRAGSDHSLRPDADIQAVSVLVAYVVTGCEPSARNQLKLSEILPLEGPSASVAGSPRQWLERIWRLLLPEIAGESESLRPEGMLR